MDTHSKNMSKTPKLKELGKPTASLKQLIDSYTHLSFFEVNHGFVFFPKSLSKYFRSRSNKLNPLILSQFSQLLKDQEILHFQKLKTADEVYNFSHFLAKFTQMKIIEELLENSLDKMCYKSFSFLARFVKILKKQHFKEFQLKQTFINSGTDSGVPVHMKSITNQLLNTMRISFIISKKHNRLEKYILLPVYGSGRFSTE